jgi:hypothetical protein
MGMMQDKILKAIRKKVEEAGFEWVAQPRWANTGSIYVQIPSAFDNVLGFHYDFQDSYCTLQFYPGGVAVIGTCGFTHETCIKDFHMLHYTQTSRINEMLAFVENHLKEKSCGSHSGKKRKPSSAASPGASGAP